MSSLIVKFATLAATVSLAAGLLVAQKPAAAPAASTAPPAKTLKIGILPFTDATGSGSDAAPAAISHMVQAEFVHSTDIEALALSLGNVSQDDLDADHALAIGRAHHVDAVVLGTILQADTSESNHGGGSAIFGQLVGANVHSTKAEVVLQADVFNVATGAKIDSLRVKGNDSQKGVGASADTTLGSLSTGGNEFSNSALGKAIQKAVAQLVRRVAAERGKF